MENADWVARFNWRSASAGGIRGAGGYVVAITSTLVAWGLTVATGERLPAPNYLPFAAAVAIATWYGGAWPGVLASVLAVTAIDFSFLPPISRLEFSHSEELLDMGVFLLVAITIGATTSALRRARALAEAHAADAALANTALQRKVEEVQRLSEELQRTRQDTLNVVAHDLRNPLQLMGATVELLADDSVSAARRREAAAIGRRAVRQMRRLIEDLLDMARLQAGGLSLDLTEVSIESLVSQAVETFTPAADDKRIRLSASITTSDAWVRADPERVQQVLGNLLGNALKFTRPGGEVILSAATNGNDATFRVSDTGSGIAAENIACLFEPFWQAHHGDRRGLGLGLKIAKGIVEAHNGHMGVESTPGIGSSFWFTLPLSNAAADRYS